MPAPRNPWIARHRIISLLDEAKPQSRLEKVKPAAEIANNSRVPSARDRKPDNGIAITSAIRYAVCTHETSVELAESPAWMSDKDAETIWMSRIDMNIPNTMMMNATTRFGSMVSETTGTPPAGLAVVALAMIVQPVKKAATSTLDGSSSANRDRCRHRHPRHPCWCRRWRRPTCRRGAGFRARRSSARGRAREDAARSW